jgi:hypothetical protein
MVFTKLRLAPEVIRETSPAPASTSVSRIGILSPLRARNLAGVCRESFLSELDVHRATQEEGRPHAAGSIGEAGKARFHAQCIGLWRLPKMVGVRTQHFEMRHSNFVMLPSRFACSSLVYLLSVINEVEMVSSKCH